MGTKIRCPNKERMSFISEFISASTAPGLVKAKTMTPQLAPLSIILSYVIPMALSIHARISPRSTTAASSTVFPMHDGYDAPSLNVPVQVEHSAPPHPGFIGVFV